MRRGDLHDRHRARGRIALDAAGDLDAAHVRQIDVEQHETGVLLAHQLERVGAGSRLDHRVARLPQHARLGVARRAVSSTLRISVAVRSRGIRRARTRQTPLRSRNARVTAAVSSLFSQHELRLRAEALPLRRRQVARGHDRDRHRRRTTASSPQRAEHVLAAAVGQVQVEEDGRRPRAARGLEAALAIARLDHARAAVAQQLLQHVARRGIVVDDQHLSARERIELCRAALDASMA